MSAGNFCIPAPQHSAGPGARAAIGADEYRRQARRLRARLADRPAELYRSLRVLAGRADHAPRIPVPAPQGQATAFAARVQQTIDGPVLRYSRRMELISAAEQQGIGRFEANLIIAAVLHRARPHNPPNDPARPGLLPSLLTFLVVQSAIIASGVALWATLLR